MRDKMHLNIDQIPKELKLILKLLATDDGSNAAKAINEFQDVDWALFLELAMHHRIFPLLHWKLKNFNNSIIPTYVNQTLSEAYKKNTFKMLQLSGEMEHISKFFNENNIRMLVLKGPVLAEDLYGDLSLRTCGDLDILVSFNDLDMVDKIIQSLGFMKETEVNRDLNAWKWRNHHIGYIHPNKRVVIEIHWRLHPFPGEGPGFEQLWLRKRVSEITNYPVYYLGKEDLFFFLVSHGARHGWFRIRWLVDIKQIVKQKIDWDYFIKLLKRYQYLYVSGQAIILGHVLLKIPIKKEMEKLIKGNHPNKLAQEAIFYLEKVVNIHLEPMPKEVEEYHKKYLVSILTLRQKCLYYLSLLYPYPIDVETLPLPKYFQFLYFPLRPFLWAWRKTVKRSLLKM